MKQLTSMGMRAHMFANPRKLRDMPLGMDEAYFFPGYNGFPGQQFPNYFNPQQNLGYPPSKFGWNTRIPLGKILTQTRFVFAVGPGMEQPLPPGGPMGGNEFPMPPMNNMVGEAFPPHQSMTNGCEELPNHAGGKQDQILRNEDII